MLKAVFALFALFLTLSLYASSDAQVLSQAQKHLHSANKGDIFRAYNDYKTLYLKAMMNQDEPLREKALGGIVASGKKLHIDVAAYENELRMLQNRKNYLKQEQKYVKPTPKPNKPSKQAKKIKLNSATKLKSIYWRGGKLVLRFSKRLRKHQVNYFKLYDAKTNRYKYVFDIDASLLSRSQNLVKPGIESIRIAQFKPNKIRLVFKNDSVVKIRFKIAGNEIVINATPTKKVKKRIKPKTKQPPATVPVSKYKRITQKTIVIDPGHGGKDPGAIGYGRYKEKDVVLAISKYVRDYLKMRGYKVYMTRANNRFIKLRHRTRYANKKKADLFVSIHANASKHKKAKGIETYFLSPSRSSRAKRVAAMENKADIDDMNYYAKQSFLMFMNNHKIVASNKLAIDLQQGVLHELRKHYKGVVDGGVREGPFWVLVGAQMPAVLIEVGFITNKEEAKRLVNKTYQKRFAKGIAEGIERYFIKNR